jgi:hypothetical protein
MRWRFATVSTRTPALGRKILRDGACQLNFHVNRAEPECAGLPVAINPPNIDASSANVDSNSDSRESVCACLRKTPWVLYGRCFFSLCGSLIHNTGAWNLADLYIM